MIRLCAFSDEAAKPLGEQIAAMKRNNITLTELRSVDGVNVKNITAEAAREYVKELEDSGIAVWAVGSPLGKVDVSVDMTEYLDKVKHICELANCLKTDKIRMFSFFNAYGDRSRVIENLNLMVECAKGFGVELYHENEKDIYGDTVERVLDILDNVDGLKCVYDPANFLQCGESADLTLDKVHRRSDYFHIKDVISETGELVPAGYGDGRIDKLIDMITDDKVLTLEPHLKLFGAYSQIDEHDLRGKYQFKTNDESFDFAANALKGVLRSLGFEENEAHRWVR